MLGRRCGPVGRNLCHPRAAYRRWSGLSRSVRILIGLGLGILAGLFFGEPAAIRQPAADVYIRLMQMTVLPYLITSLVIPFGQLDAAEAKRLPLRGGILLLLVWAVSALVLAALLLGFLVLPLLVTARSPALRVTRCWPPASSVRGTITGSRARAPGTPSRAGPFCATC